MGDAVHSYAIDKITTWANCKSVGLQEKKKADRRR